MTIEQRPTGWNSVHLPLVYKISNDKFPTNSVDPIVNVTDSGGEYGYYLIDCDANIKTGIQVLDFVLVEVNGIKEVHQVITKYSDSSIVIDLKQTYGITVTFGIVQFYYSNYNIKVKIYGGLRSGHTLEADKPTQLLTNINVVPGSDNVAVFNINETIKTDIGILNNNLNLSTLQNDIDAFTEFYIEYAESYDSSDGNILSTYTSSYTSDSVNYAIAVNSKMPFRNGEGGNMIMYQGGIDFLTTFETPVLFNGQYYDIWILKGQYDSSNMTVERYKDGSLINTDTISIDSKDEGVYRIPLSVTSDEDQLMVTVEGNTKTIDVNNNCYNQSIYLTWLNYLGGMDYWLFTAQKDFGVDIEEVQQTEKNIFINWADSYGLDRIKYDIKRISRENILVRSQNLTQSQVEGLKYIKTSPLVQMYDAKPTGDWVNVLVDSSSFTVYSETEKLYSISFTIQMTNEVAAQSL